MNRAEAGRLGYLASIDKIKIYFSQLRVRYYDKPSICIHCGNILDYSKRGNKFCNSNCAASYNNKSRKTSKLCVVCGKEVERKNKYCDECIDNNYDHHRGVPKTILFSDVKTDRVRRKWLIYKNGHKCEICEGTEWLGVAIPLLLDHIDGYHEHNTEENCRVICHNCDALLPTYKNRNKGRGRKNRRLDFNASVAKRTTAPDL